MEKTAKIYVAGHHGLVGSAIWNNLQQKGYTNLVGRSHKELDLLDGQAVKKFFDEEQPQYVILAAAHVGGIMANSLYRADFIYQNLQIQQNVIGESFRHDVKKLLFLGSTCIYPRDAVQPMKEDVLLTSPLEYTNEPYAIAKIAGLKMCESFNLQYGTNYIAVMPTNLYGFLGCKQPCLITSGYHFPGNKRTHAIMNTYQAFSLHVCQPILYRMETSFAPIGNIMTQSKMIRFTKIFPVSLLAHRKN